MNILVIGQNGREHALAQKYAESSKVKKVVMTPGNGLTDLPAGRQVFSKIKNYPDVGMWDFEKIVDVCKKEKIDLVDVAQDDIIAAGYVDKLTKLGIKAFGPTQKASQLEWDKEWSRNFMVKYGLPIPEFKAFTSKSKATAYVRGNDDKLLFIKAAGLAGGKGVIRAENKKEAISAISAMDEFGKSGETFLIEEGLIGEEFSLFALCNGDNFKIVGWAQDHKTVFDGDKGSNTGGMGSVAPTSVVTKEILKEAETKILIPLMDGMEKEGRPYKGILYLGAMKTSDGIKIIEFNCRWGDPEAEVILPSLKTDYLKVIESILDGKLKNLKIDIDNKVRVSVAGCSKGYPGNYAKVKDKEILGLLDAIKIPGVKIFGSGVKRKGNKFYATGGRLFYVVGEGKNIADAREKAYKAMKLISIEGNNLHFRTDIGWRDMARLRRASAGKKEKK